MIKKSIFLILFTIHYSLFTTATASAASKLTPTPTVSEANKSDALNEQINNLKTRIASRVAQLKLVEKRGIIGIVSEVTDTQITISDLKNNTRFVDVDELTRFSNPSVKGAFGISDITKGTNITVLGLYNKESRRLLARFVNVITLPKIIQAVVSVIDNKNYSFKVATADKKEININVETTTKTSSFSKDAGLIRSGFSKIKENEVVIVVSSTNDNDALTASRIILFPEILKKPE